MSFALYILIQNLLSAGLLTLVVIQDGLAHAHRLGSNLDQLVLLDVFQTLLKTHDDLGDDASLFVCTRSTHVGELLGLADVDDEVVVVNMLTYNLTHIDILAWIDEELTTVLQFVDGVGKGITSLEGNH